MLDKACFIYKFFMERDRIHLPRAGSRTEFELDALSADGSPLRKGCSPRGGRRTLRSSRFQEPRNQVFEIMTEASVTYFINRDAVGSVASWGGRAGISRGCR